MIKPPPERIIWCYKRWQPLFSEMQNTIKNILFVQGLPENLNDESFIDIRYPSLIIIDDLMRDATNSKDVCELFVEGSHHRNISVACILQNAFSKGKENRTMSINSQYVVLFKNPRDQVGAAVFARQMYPNNPNKFMTKYKEGTQRPYGFLFIDLKQNTPDEERLKTDIFKDNMGNDSYSRQMIDSPPFMLGGSKISKDKNKGGYITDDTSQIVQSTDNSPDINMDKQVQNHSCIDCGLLFSTPFDVQRHVKRGCPFQEDENEAKKLKYDESVYSDDSDESLDDNSDMDDSAFNPIINEVYKKLHNEYESKIETIKKEQELSETAAKKEVDELFLPRERKLLMKLYKNMMTTMYAIKRSPLHRKITNEIQSMMQDYDYTFEKASAIAMRKNKHLFDELLDHGDDSDSEDETEEDDNSDNDDDVQED